MNWRRLLDIRLALTLIALGALLLLGLDTLANRNQSPALGVASRVDQYVRNEMDSSKILA